MADNDSDRHRVNELRSVVSANLDDARGWFDGRKRRRLAEVMELLAAVRRDTIYGDDAAPLDRSALIDELADIHDLTVGARNGPKLADQAIISFRRATRLAQLPENALSFMFRGMVYCLAAAIALVTAFIVWNGYGSFKAIIETPTVPFLAAVAGAVGAMVSVAMRIAKSDMPPYWMPGEMILKGAVRPLIGAAIGVFSYAVIKGKLIPIAVGEGEVQVYAFLAIAFASGFGERVQIDAASLLPGRRRASERDKASGRPAGTDPSRPVTPRETRSPVV